MAYMFPTIKKTKIGWLWCWYMDNKIIKGSKNNNRLPYTEM